MTRRWLRRWQEIRRGLRPQVVPRSLAVYVHADDIDVAKLARAVRIEINRQRVGGGITEARP